MSIGFTRSRFDYIVLGVKIQGQPKLFGFVRPGQLGANLICMDIIEKGVLHIDRRGESYFEWTYW